MALLAASSPVPIALDEELIGYNTPEKKKELLSFINPQYIILKPSLHGGLYGCSEWIKEAQDRQIGWDHFCIGIECRPERHRSMVRNFRQSASARVRNRWPLHQQH